MSRVSPSLLFGEAFPLLQPLYPAGALGEITASDMLGMTPGRLALVLIVVAIAAFLVAARVERKVNPASPLVCASLTLCSSPSTLQ